MGSLLSRCNCCFNCKKHFDDDGGTRGNKSPVNTDPSTLDCVESLEEPKQYSWDTRPKIDPQDYTISNLHSNQSVKRPGDVHGQQFIIKNCTNSKIYLFDYSSSVTIDDCSDCLIVLGPVQGSVFLRDTKNTTLVCSSSQLRLRDCQNIHLFVGCESDPIIEASCEVVVGPYFLSYKAIADHFKLAKISKYKAVHWSEIYDFTPNDLSSNWNRYNKEKHNPQKYICLPQPSDLFCDLDISLNERLSFVPVTHKGEGDPDGTLMGKSWRKQEVTFTLEPGQDLIVLEEFMDKFYNDKFLNHYHKSQEYLHSSHGTESRPKNILIDIESSGNNFTFSFYTAC